MRTRAEGHLKDFLETQLDGLTGHIEVAGYPFDRVEWGKDDFLTNNKYPNWWVYEQTAYWVDGYTRCCIALGDDEKLKRTEKIIYNVIDHPTDDGYLGPSILRDAIAARWPHAVFFRACLALYEHNKDPKIIQALKNHYLDSNLKYQYFRDVINAEIILRLYLIDHDTRLLDLAKKILRDYNSHPKSRFQQITDESIMSNRRPYCHGVTYNEYSKLGALMYLADGDRKQLEISERAISRLVKLFMLPGGVNCSDEMTISNDPREAIETCDVSDFTWTLETIKEANNKIEYSDMIERAVFNAGIGCVLEDFKALQYFSCANQMILGERSTHVAFARGKKWMSYRPNPGTECCAGNVSRFMPNYVLNMYRQRGDTIYLDLFGPSSMETEIDGKKVTITQNTRFPLSDRIDIQIKARSPFTLKIRIPWYCTGARVTSNGRMIPATPGQYLELHLNQNTSLIVQLYEAIKVIPTRRGGIYLQRGPLVYAAGMKGKRIVDESEERSTKDFPAYNIYPDKPYGYTVRSSELNPIFTPGTGERFDLDDNLPSISIDAHKLIGVKPEHLDRITRVHTDLQGKKTVSIEKGSFDLTPDLLSQDLEAEDKPSRFRLYPYGACKVRQTVFQDRNSNYYLKHFRK